MNKKTKLILALQQTENIAELMTGNEWEHYIKTQLIYLQVELKRQLSLVTVQELTQPT